MLLLLKILAFTTLAQETAPELDLSGTTLPALTWEGLLTNGLRFLMAFAALAAFFGLIYGGYLLITAGGDAAQATRAKSTLTWAIIGLIVAILALVIVQFVFSLAGRLQ